MKGVKDESGSRNRAGRFEWFLFFTAIAAVTTGAYEAMTEEYFPSRSILSMLHGLGLLKDYAIIYEPSKGIWHAVGWTGSGMMVLMMLYSVRKRFSFMKSLGSMKAWLSIHMLLGVLGPILVTFHTTFKFGGIVATSFWCMIITMVFGILGRYIYVQIPRSITGAELDERDIDREVEKLDAELGRYVNAAKVSGLVAELGAAAPSIMGPAQELLYVFATDARNVFRIYGVKRALKTAHNLDEAAADKALSILKKKAALVRRRNLLATSQKLLHYWHVLHVPLAGVMFFIMFIHIAVYFLFRAAA